jgi:hypothetical protein
MNMDNSTQEKEIFFNCEYYKYFLFIYVLFIT